MNKLAENHKLFFA